MNRYQETYQLISELKKAPTSFFWKKENLSQKIKILDRISDIGTAENIVHLVSLTQHKNKRLREKTVETIAILLKKTTRRSRIYSSLRYCDILAKDLDIYQKIYKEKHLIPLFIIASMNRNGFVRARAIQAFGKYPNPQLIKYLLFRLADWVGQNRTSARITLDQFLRREYFEVLLEQLPIVEWLLKVKRVNLRSGYEKVLNFLTVENVDYLCSVFPKQKEKHRLILARYILKGENIDARIIPILLKDKNFSIRRLIAENLSKIDVPALKEHLLNDKHNKVRLHALYSLLKMNKITKEEWISFLVDKSFWIRDLARFELKNENIDFALFYKKQIEEENNLPITILGLGEIEKIKEVAFLKKYLYHKNGLVRQSAAISIIKMDEYGIDDYLIEKLNSNDAQVKKIAINHLSRHPDNETLTQIRATYDKAEPINKIPILKLFSRVSGKRVYPDLLKGTQETDETVKEFAAKYLMYWKRNSYTIFE